MILSPWKLTYDPFGDAVVLLDFGERIAEDVVWASQRGTSVISLVRSPAPFLHDGRNVSLRASYRKLITAETPTNLLRNVMSGLISHQALAKKPLKIEAKGIVEMYWLAAAAMVPQANMSTARSGRMANVYEYEIIAAEITEHSTGLEPIPAPPYTPQDPGKFAPPVTVGQLWESVGDIWETIDNVW